MERLGRNAVAVTMAGYGVAGVAVGLAPSVIAAAPVPVPGGGVPGVDRGHPQLDRPAAEPALGEGADHEPVVAGLRRSVTTGGDPGRCGGRRPDDTAAYVMLSALGVGLGLAATRSGIPTLE